MKRKPLKGFKQKKLKVNASTVGELLGETKQNISLIKRKENIDFKDIDQVRKLIVKKLTKASGSN